MRKLILIGFCILLLPLVLAFEEGQNITQEQLDSLNLNLTTWNFLDCEGDPFPLFRGRGIINQYTCLSLDKINNDTYIVIRKDYETLVRYRSAYRCLLNFNFTICKEYFTIEVRRQALQTVEKIRLELSEFQTEASNSQIQELFENLFE